MFTLLAEGHAPYQGQHEYLQIAKAEQVHGQPVPGFMKADDEEQDEAERPVPKGAR